MSAAIAITVTFRTMSCGECGMTFAVPDWFYTKKLESGGSWHCPQGHERCFTETENQRLKRELAAKEASLAWEKERRAREERQHTATRGQLTKAKNQLSRVACGVCPLCKRNFSVLREHMKTKHPEYRFDTGVPLLPAKGETS